MKRPPHRSSNRSATPRPAAPAPAPRPDPAAIDLVFYPHPKLQLMAKDVTQFDPWLLAVAERMKDLMVLHKGVGLAAPQVGLSLRLFVASPTGKREDARVFVNPIISDEQGSEEGEEGCLSLPDIRIKVQRFTSLRIEALDEHGKAFSDTLLDYPARIAQHENDHLDGILLLDRMNTLVKLANRKKIKQLEDDFDKPKK